MKFKRGSTLLSMLMTVGGVSAIAAAGFVFTGDCGTGSCSDKKADATVVQVSNTEAKADKSCCDLGALAKKPAAPAVVPAANVEKSDCSAKSSCCGDKSEAVVVKAANTAKADSCCATKSQAKVVEASAKTECSAASSCCSSKGEAKVVAASSVEKTECAKGDSCCSSKATAQVVEASAAVKADSCCSSKKAVALQPVASAPVAASCSSANMSNVATLKCGSKNMPVRIVASSTPIVMPAMFFQAVSMKNMDMTEAGCCRSAQANASGVSTCSGVAADGSEKSCCDKGAATIPASNVEKSECTKGDSCCEAGAKVVEASNVEKSECSEAKSCCDKAKEVASN